MPCVTGAGFEEFASGVAGNTLSCSTSRTSPFLSSVMYTSPAPSVLTCGITELVPFTPIFAMIAGQPSPIGSGVRGPWVHGLPGLPAAPYTQNHLFWKFAGLL